MMRNAAMKLGLINSAWAGSPIGTAEGIRHTRRIGFDSIDIFDDPLDLNAEQRRLIGAVCREEGLPVVATVCVALGLADFNPSVRRFHCGRVKRYLEFCREMGGRNTLVVVGEYIWQQEVIAPRDQWNWAVESFRELGCHAAELGLEIALELEPFRLSIINDVPKMKAFLDQVGLPAVKANLDISHLALAGSAASEIQELRGRIAHVHFSDCDGVKHGDLPPGRGVVNFRPYLEELAKTGFDGTISIELEYSPEPGQIVAWVEEAYRETARLLRELNLR